MLVLLSLLDGAKIRNDYQNQEIVEQNRAKIIYNGKMVTKFDFLQIAFENFRQCLSFALKFRNNNFLTFFEAEYKKASPMKILAINGQFKRTLINNRDEKRPLSTAAGKLSTSRLNKISSYSGHPDNNKLLGKSLSQGIYVEESDPNVNFHNISAIN